MISFTPEQVFELLQSARNKTMCSECGYFSKPFRLIFEDEEFIVKTFLPIRDEMLVKFILHNHENYIAELRSVGIKIPQTFIESIARKNKHQIVIIQHPFREDELLRNILAKAPLSEIVEICKLLFDDIMKYICFLEPLLGFGFHPSLRNYALRKGQLWFIDTFPPMYMPQKILNRIIIVMSPYGRLIKKITPLRVINLVSNEYYFIPSMFTGIVGSCCRLRPEMAGAILAFSKEYVNGTDLITPDDKLSILEGLNAPPRLSKLWLLWRRLSGNIGKPNV